MDAETCKRELLIEIPLDAVRKEAEKVTAEYSRLARIPGFRPGRAPASVVRQRYREEIRGEVVKALLPRFFAGAVKEQQLSVVGQPEFEDLKYEEDLPLTCKATFEVVPQFELKDYKGLEGQEQPSPVTEEEVEGTLADLRESAATFDVISDRPAADGDDVTISYEARDVHDPGRAPIAAKETVIRLGGEGTEPAFNENLRGARPGERRDFRVSYPEETPDKRLAGRTIGYRIEVQSIKAKVLPALDDELAKTVSEFATLEELSARIRQDAEKLHQRQAQREVRNDLLEQLLKKHEFPVPAVLVDEEIERRLRRIVSQLLAQGADLRAGQVDWRKLREDARPDAEKAVRASIILAKIAEAEKIEVSEEELDQAVREVARDSRETPAALKTRLTRDGGLAKLQSSRRSQKALDFIYHNAKITRPMSQSEPVPREAGQES